MLRRPPSGFEDIVRGHFRLLRPLLERQLKRWVAEAQSDSTRDGMLRTYAELRPLLDKVRVRVRVRVTDTVTVRVRALTAGPRPGLPRSAASMMPCCAPDIGGILGDIVEM